jgi:hypothetical protein
LGGRDHEVWSNEHLPGIDSAGPYPAVNHVDALPPTRYTSTIGNEDPPRVNIVGVHFISRHAPLLTVAVPKGFGQRQLDANHPTPGGITQYIPTDLGPPPLEQYAPAIPVRLVYPAPFLVHMQSFLLRL